MRSLQVSAPFHRLRTDKRVSYEHILSIESYRTTVCWNLPASRRTKLQAMRVGGYHLWGPRSNRPLEAVDFSESDFDHRYSPSLLLDTLNETCIRQSRIHKQKFRKKKIKIYDRQTSLAVWEKTKSLRLFTRNFVVTINSKEINVNGISQIHVTFLIELDFISWRMNLPYSFCACISG